MSGDEIARFSYLALLGVAIAGYFFANHRQSLGKNLQYALIWALLFLGVVAGIGLWQDVRDEVLMTHSTAENGVIEVPKARDGHFYLTLQVNDTPVNFVVDTGASGVVLNQEDAARVGLEPDSLKYYGTANTANGPVSTAPVRLNEVRLGEIVDRRLRAYVNQGALEESLLGMDYLERFETIEIKRDRLVLSR